MLYSLRPTVTLCLLWGVVIHAFKEETVVHERRIPNPNWKRQQGFPSLLQPSEPIIFKFGLRESNLGTLYDELMKVSNPESSLYGNHWSPEEVIEHFAPSNVTVEKVSQWFQSQAFKLNLTRPSTMSPGRRWLIVQLTLREAEALLDTRYHSYVHKDTGRAHIACEDYKLPRDLSDHIDVVIPTVHFDTNPINNKYRPYVGLPKMDSGKRHVEPASSQIAAAPAINPVPGAARRIGNPSSGNIPQYSQDLNSSQIVESNRTLEKCANVTTLDCLKKLYNFGNYTLRAPKNHTLAIVEYTPQSVIYKDLDLFLSNFSPATKGARPKLIPIDGGEIDQDLREFELNGESNLDLQYSIPFVHPLNVILYQVGDTSVGASFNNFLDALDATYCSKPLDPIQDGIYPDPLGYSKRDCGIIKPANIISTSYGMNEADATPAYLKRQCTEYGKLGLMGVTFLFSSGDNGVAGNRGVCLDRDGSQSVEGTLFNPSFPSTCPYVTSVGATQLPAGKTVHDPEVACYTRIQSGGGFSNVFELPKYQAATVKSYFTNHRPSYGSNRFNDSRRTRGFPDLSANGANFVVAVDGKFGLVYGTSAAAPVVASILTMINDARIMKGKKPVGFINPAIYSPLFQHAFNDIKNGTNPGCRTHGFSAVPGWDPVTGLGTPDFQKLLQLWTKL